ncbi:hypothetical protein H0H93_016387 [Arthromyces matolae]|nr:hypothetical protein H0H93_016387 [Arthromyces matolae]
MFTFANKPSSRTSSPSTFEDENKAKGTQFNSRTHNAHTHRETCGVAAPGDVHNATPNSHGPPQGQIRPIAWNGLRRATVAGNNTEFTLTKVRDDTPLPIILPRRFPLSLNINLTLLNNSQFRSGAGFFVPPHLARRRFPIRRSRTLRERCGITFFIRFLQPYHRAAAGEKSAQHNEHTQPGVGNLPRRRRAVTVPQKKREPSPAIHQEARKRGLLQEEEATKPEGAQTHLRHHAHELCKPVPCTTVQGTTPNSGGQPQGQTVQPTVGCLPRRVRRTTVQNNPTGSVQETPVRITLPPSFPPSVHINLALLMGLLNQRHAPNCMETAK